MTRFFLCTWYQPLHELGKRKLHSQLHKVRDGLSGVYVSSMLTELGYHFGGALVNAPAAICPNPREAEFVARRGDIIWLATRPPLDEDILAAEVSVKARTTRRRIIDRSGAGLESMILQSLRPYFDVCSRTRISISKKISLMAPGDGYRNCTFHEFSGGMLKEHGATSRTLYQPHKDRLSIGYLLALPSMPGLGRIVAGFGPGGTETLLFSQLLVTHFRDTVLRMIRTDEPRLFLASFSLPETVSSPLLEYTLDALEPEVLTPRPATSRP